MDMESVIIEEMRAFLRLGLPERQRKYFADTIDVAKRVEVVPAADVIQTIVKQTGYYGDIYRFCYCAAQMALEKMNPRT